MRADSLFQKAVEYQIKNPNLTVCDAMKLADFSLREREDKAKYMMVIRLLNKTKKDDFVTPPAQLSITVSRSSSDLIFSVTMSADGGVTSAPAKKAKRVRSTNHAAKHTGTTAGACKCTWSWRSVSCDGWDACHIRRCLYLNGDERPK